MTGWTNNGHEVRWNFHTINIRQRGYQNPYESLAAKMIVDAGEFKRKLDAMERVIKHATLQAAALQKVTYKDGFKSLGGTFSWTE